jgi:cytochrome c553
MQNRVGCGCTAAPSPLSLAARARSSAVAIAATLVLPGPGWSAPDDVPSVVETVCQACHMLDGNSVVPAFPKLAGQQQHYLEKQLEDWRSGKRTIEAMGAFLPQVSSADVRRIARYYAAQPRAPGTVQDPALAQRGESVYLDGNEESGVPSCEACHQWEGEGNERYPRLAGQHQAYTIKSLQDMRADVREGGIMNRIAGRMTDAEIEAVAEYIAGLSGVQSE